MRFPRIIAITFALLAAMAASAQTSTYAIGQGTCSPGGGISCRAPLYLATADPASFWLAEDSGAWPNRNFIEFNEGLSDLGTATINHDASYQPTYGTMTATRNGITKTAKEITSLSLTYYGTDANGDAYQGAMTISFDWYYVWTCSGRGCGGTLGWHKRVTGGSTTFSIARYYASPESPIAPMPTCLDKTVGHCTDPQ